MVPSMGKLRDTLTKVRFYCSSCDERFDAEPGRIDDAPDDTYHPWQYAALCPLCGTECAQDARERGLLKAWASATGPRTAEGKTASAANLVGHPTPEATRRTRFNALKHGMAAKTATYFPARPGKYPHCTNCEYLETICWKQVACLKRTELLLKHQIAFETGDPALLTDLRAQLHANVQALLDDMVLALVQDGVRIKTPEWFYDKDGHFRWARGEDEHGNMVQLYKIEQHPLLRTFGEMIAKLGLGLVDQGMTPKVQDDADIVRGHLSGNARAADDTLDYQRRTAIALEGLGDLMKRSREKAARDPVLIEHQQAETDPDG